MLASDPATGIFCTPPHRGLAVSDLTFRSRTVTELVDAAFRLYRQHFVELVTLSTIVYFPIIIVIIAYVVLTGTAPGDPDFASLTTSSVASIVLGLGGLGVILWYPVARTAINVSVSELYHGRAIDSGTAIRAATSRYGTVLGAMIAKWTIVVLGFLVGIFLLGAPAFYFLARFFAVPNTVVLEGNGVGDAFSRSSQLALGYKWRILRTLVLGWILVFAISIAASFIILAILAIVALSGGNPDEVSPTLAMVMQLPSIVAYIIGLPLTVILETLLYYDMRIRQEGYDLDVMTAQLAISEPEAAIGEQRPIP
jgi:hypothetical protein